MAYSIVWMRAVCDCVCKIMKNNCDFGGQQYLNRLCGSDLVFLVIKQIHGSVISEKLPTAEVLCREMRDQASLVIRVFCMHWSERLCLWRAGEHSSEHPCTFVYGQSSGTVFARPAVRWKLRVLSALVLTEPDNSKLARCSWTPHCCAKYTIVRRLRMYTCTIWSISTGCWGNRKFSRITLARLYPADQQEMGTWQVLAEATRSSSHGAASSIWTINWIRQWGLAGHQLTIGAPRRPMMSGRGLRLWRSMTQGQLNVSGAK